MGFKELKIKDLDFNPFTMLGEEWMVLSVGSENIGHNAMTVAWGSFGPIWHTENGGGYMPTVTIFVRPQRYTHELIEKEEYFALSTLKDKKALAYLGSHSGKYSDKIRNAGLNVNFSYGTSFVDESDLVFICKKDYRGSLKEEEFIDKNVVSKDYPKKDFHDFYVAEIVKVLKKTK